MESVEEKLVLEEFPAVQSVGEKKYVVESVEEKSVLEEFPAVQSVVEEKSVVESVEENEFPPMAESVTAVHGVIDDIVAEVMNNIEESLLTKSEDELGEPRRSE